MDYAVKKIYGKIKNGKADVSVCGSKSITARAMLIAALAQGDSVLYGAQFSDDCAVFFKALCDLGVKCSAEGTTVKITGTGGSFPVDGAKIYVGSAGTAARFLCAALAFQSGEYVLECSEQMRRRPVKPLIEALQSLGAQFTFYGEEYCFPFKIKGNAHAGGEVTADIGKSSQFLSALLIAATCASSPVNIRAAGEHGLKYVEMTVDMMWSFGVTVAVNGAYYGVNGHFTGKKYDIEPDVSAACYFYAMNKLLGTQISVRGIFPHTMQGDYEFIELLKNFDGGEVDASRFSDQALTLAAIAPFLSKPTRVMGVAHIRGQECDRISAAVSALTALGVRAEESADGFTVYPSIPHGGRVNTFGDHRVAMSFALVGLRVDGVVIENCEVCKKTFAGYFTLLDGLCAQLTK